MGPHAHGDGGGGKGTARLAGGATSGALELIIFHPVDTIAKRLMSNQNRLFVPGDVSATRNNVNQVIFRQAAE